MTRRHSLSLSSPFAPSLALAVLAATGCGGSDQMSKMTTPEPMPPAAPAPAVAPTPPAPTVKNEDFLYLEESQARRRSPSRVLTTRSPRSSSRPSPGFQTLQDRLFSIYSSKERIPSPRIQNDSLRNFWTDAEHPRGLWRQTTLADYKKPKPTWTTLLDIDALGKAEKQSFVYHGAICLHPQYKKCLVHLSKGGGDCRDRPRVRRRHEVVRPGGFVLPEAKSRIAWKDANTVYVGTDFGPGTLTNAGYPRTAREWKRGTPLTAAVQIFEAKDTDVSASCQSRLRPRLEARLLRTIRSTSSTHELSQLKDGKLVRSTSRTTPTSTRGTTR